MYDGSSQCQVGLSIGIVKLNPLFLVLVLHTVRQYRLNTFKFIVHQLKFFKWNLNASMSSLHYEKKVFTVRTAALISVRNSMYD